MIIFRFTLSLSPSLSSSSSLSFCVFSVLVPELSVKVINRRRDRERTKKWKAHASERWLEDLRVEGSKCGAAMNRCFHAPELCVHHRITEKVKGIYLQLESPITRDNNRYFWTYMTGRDSILASRYIHFFFLFLLYFKKKGKTENSHILNKAIIFAKLLKTLCPV